MTIRKLLILGTALPFLFVGQAAQSAEEADPSLIIELNNLQPNGTACRASFLVQNKLKSSLKSLEFEIVLFDSDERITQLLSIATGAFPENKSRVSQFDLPETDCTGIGRMMLNTITVCDGGDLSAETCLNATETRSRAGVDLVY
ncbi:MAG: hypothetical protein AAGE89_00650 [Pseudomonadota bacterium]